MSKLLTSIVLICLSQIVHAEDTSISQLFNKAGANGTLLIESIKTGQRFVHNDARSNQTFTSASTFKVLNTLIGLEEGKIANSSSTFQWDGTLYNITDWNRDQTLESAFQVSCVWCYQELARRVGAEKYPTYIQQAHYGQLHEPFNGTQFWLDGSLTISAEQQVAFLKQVVQRRLPYHADSYNTLKSIMLVETNPHYQLYAKTGWATQSTPRIGWYIGYVEVAEDTWLFALNLDTQSEVDLLLRKQLTLEALQIKNILPAS